MAKYGGGVGRDDKEAPATSVMEELVDNWGMAILDLTFIGRKGHGKERARMILISWPKRVKIEVKELVRAGGRQ